MQDFGTTLISSMLSVKLQLCKTEQVRSSIYSKGRKIEEETVIKTYSMSKLLVTVLKMAAMVSKTSFEMAPVVLSLESES